MIANSLAATCWWFFLQGKMKKSALFFAASAAMMFYCLGCNAATCPSAACSIPGKLVACCDGNRFIGITENDKCTETKGECVDPTGYKCNNFGVCNLCPTGKYCPDINTESTCPTNASPNYPSGQTTGASNCNCNEGYSVSSAWSGTATTTTAGCQLKKGTITYNSAGSGSTASSDHSYGIAKALTANGFTNGTNKFAGWAVAAGGTTIDYANTQSVIFTTSPPPANLYAVWVACACDNANANANCAAVNLAAPATDCDCDKTCATGYEHSSGNTANICDAGYCTAKTVTITLNKNGGTGDVATDGSGNTQGTSTAAGADNATHDCTYAAECTLPVTTGLTVSGKIQAGKWCDSADGTGA